MSSYFGGVADKRSILIIEPFYGGSRKKLIDTLVSGLPKDSYQLITMKPILWEWRALTSALYVSSKISSSSNFKILFCTSVLGLSELLGLRPELLCLRKIIYFHGTQLVHPTRFASNNYFQFGYREILSCLAADVVLFNSRYSKEAFLKNVDKHNEIQPDYRVTDLQAVIRPKCKVIYFPLDLPRIELNIPNDQVQKYRSGSTVLHIVWPHRWELDKNPYGFVKVLKKMVASHELFKVSILGQSINKNNEKTYEPIINLLRGRLIKIGYLDEDAYYRHLASADVVVSTALQEFFGVAVMEAVYCGCIPVLPRRLVYRELYENSVDEMYSTPEQLYSILKRLCMLKLTGKLNKSYRHLAMPFDSTVWNIHLMDIMYPQPVDEDSDTIIL